MSKGEHMFSIHSFFQNVSANTTDNTSFSPPLLATQTTTTYTSVNKTGMVKNKPNFSTTSSEAAAARMVTANLNRILPNKKWTTMASTIQPRTKLYQRLAAVQQRRINDEKVVAIALAKRATTAMAHTKNLTSLKAGNPIVNTKVTTKTATATATIETTPNNSDITTPFVGRGQCLEEKTLYQQLAALQQRNINDTKRTIYQNDVILTMYQKLGTIQQRKIKELNINGAEAVIFQRLAAIQQRKSNDEKVVVMALAKRPATTMTHTKNLTTTKAKKVKVDTIVAATATTAIIETTPNNSDIILPPVGWGRTLEETVMKMNNVDDVNSSSNNNIGANNTATASMCNIEKDKIEHKQQMKLQPSTTALIIPSILENRVPTTGEEAKKRKRVATTKINKDKDYILINLVKYPNGPPNNAPQPGSKASSLAIIKMERDTIRKMQHNGTNTTTHPRHSSAELYQNNPPNPMEKNILSALTDMGFTNEMESLCCLRRWAIDEINKCNNNQNSHDSNNDNDEGGKGVGGNRSISGRLTTIAGDQIPSLISYTRLLVAGCGNTNFYSIADDVACRILVCLFFYCSCYIYKYVYIHICIVTYLVVFTVINSSFLFLILLPHACISFCVCVDLNFLCFFFVLT